MAAAATASALGLAGAAQMRAPARPLRVAQVVTKLSAGAGGITLRGALAMPQESFATTIVTSAGGSLVPQAEEAGLEVVPVRHMAADLSPASDLRGVAELTALLRSQRFDVVHTHSAKAGAIGRLAAHRAGVPAVVHSFHGFPFHPFQSWARRRSYLSAERKLARITDHFLTDGSMVAAEAVRLRLAAPDRITAIASPVDSDIPRVTSAARLHARRLLGIPPEAKVVGTLARLDPQKSPRHMVAAIAGLARPDVHMVWIGDGELRAETERLIAEHGLRDRFLLAGHRADAPQLLPALDVFALSSLHEGLPCALVEAMTCGIPVVATAVDSVPEIVIAGRTGLLARPGDAASLQQALAHMLDQPADAARMATAARRHIGDRFRPEILGDILGEVYRRALGAGTARRGEVRAW